MSPKERFLSEQIAWIGWRIPGLSHTLKRNFHDSITRRKREKLEALEEQVLQNLKLFNLEKIQKKHRVLEER